MMRHNFADVCDHANEQAMKDITDVCDHIREKQKKID